MLSNTTNLNRMYLLQSTIITYQSRVIMDGDPEGCGRVPQNFGSSRNASRPPISGNCCAEFDQDQWLQGFKAPFVKCWLFANKKRQFKKKTYRIHRNVLSFISPEKNFRRVGTAFTNPDISRELQGRQEMLFTTKTYRFILIVRRN